MPRAAIESSTATPERHKPPHERPSGPWDNWETEEAGHTLERAEKIKANGKFVEHIAKHHEKKAKLHHGLAEKARHLRKHGAVSDKALERAAERKHARS